MATNLCENCNNYVYDEESGIYYCEINLDEDEMLKFISGTNTNCNYFSSNDDYLIVRKQN